VDDPLGLNTCLVCGGGPLPAFATGGLAGGPVAAVLTLVGALAAADGASVAGRGPRGGERPITVNFHITTPDANLAKISVTYLAC
jgi:hypothetical protein